MIVAVIVVLAVGLFIIFITYIEDTLMRVIKWTRHHDNRISSLEVKDTVQDERLDQHDQRFHEDERAVRMLGKDVDELSKDVGWADDKRRTQVMDINPPDDDSNPL